MTTARTAKVLATVLAAGSLTLAGTTAARADTGITVQSAGNDTANNGKFDVSLTAPTDIDDLTVSLYSMSTQQTVAMVSDFTLASGTAQSGTWVTRTRLQLPALGSYRIDVSATDAGGDTLSRTGAGYYFYEVRTSFKNTQIDRHAVDYFNRSVTLSGQLVGQWPGSGEVTPMGGLTVDVQSWFTDEQATTADDGTFSASVPFTQAADIQASYGFDPAHLFYAGSASHDYPISLTQTPTKIVETPSTLKVPFKGVVNSTSATLLWDSPTGWQPLAGKTIESNSFGDHIGLTTDANGNVVFPATPPLWLDTTIGMGWTSDDPFLANAVASRAITVVQPSSFQSFGATRTDAGTVTASGEMEFDGNETPGTIPVDIQFSATGKGGWSTVTTVADAWWDGTGYGFSADVPGTTAGFWRATYTGAPQFDNAVSQVVYVPAS